MTETLHAETVDCGLTVTATRATPGALHLHYRVQNRTSLPLYLCNLLWTDVKINPATQQEQFDVPSDSVYICATNGAVSVGMTVIDLPVADGIKIFQVPCLTRVAPHQVYEAYINLLLPLVPYQQTESLSQPQKLADRGLNFELGYFSGTPQVQAHLSEVDTTAGAAYAIESFLAKGQVVVAVGPFQTPVAVDAAASKERALWN